jgi:hypothetical protein
MGKPTYGKFSFPSAFGFSGSGGKEMAAQREAEMPMNQRLMPARALRPMGAAMPDRERAMIDPAQRVQRPQQDVSPDRARARVMDQMEQMGGRKELGVNTAAERNMKMLRWTRRLLKRSVKKHASMPAAKAHKGLGVPVRKSKPKIA